MRRSAHLQRSGSGPGPHSDEPHGAKSSRAERALPADERPYDFTPVHTADLPELPTRDRNIAGSAWVEAPAELRTLGAEIGHPEAAYKRRIGGWLLWRAGPAKGDARYLAVDPTDLSRSFAFRLRSDGPDEGVGPSGTTHARFRTWKEDLRDHPVPEVIK